MIVSLIFEKKRVFHAAFTIYFWLCACCVLPQLYIDIIIFGSVSNWSFEKVGQIKFRAVDKIESNLNDDFDKIDRIEWQYSF